MKTLHLCVRVPFPPTDGGAIGVYDIISNLTAQGCDVTLLAVNTPKHFQPDHVLADKGRLITIFVDTNPSVVKAFFNLFKSIPYVFERFVSQTYTERLIQLLKTEKFDIIQVEGSQMAAYLPVIRKYCQTPVVLRAHNVEYTIWHRLAQNENNIFKKLYLKLLATRIRNFEQKYFDAFDAIAAITKEDEVRIRELGCKARIEIIPAGVEMSRFVIREDIKYKPKTLFMIGALNWLPNLEGIDWFFANIWPKVKKECPDLELHLAGSSPPEYLMNLQLPDVTVHGFVPSASDFMQSYGLMLVPLLSGGGMRIKIIEGMATGKCILSTPVGAEGIHCENGRNILISDDPANWVALIRDYYNGKIDIDKIGQAAAINSQETYDNRVTIQKFIRLYQDLINKVR